MTDLYIIQAKTTGAIKIGRSKQVEYRIKQLQTGCPYRLRLLVHLPGQGNIERSLHYRLLSHRIRQADGEWFYERCIYDLPDWIYEKLDLENADWWRD
jgi:hypothetical protein